MLKFVIRGKDRDTYGFGLSEANMNRLQFNHEPIFFDYAFAGTPNVYGLILCMYDFPEPEDIIACPEAVNHLAIPYLNHRVTFDNLRVFPVCRSVTDKLKEDPTYCFAVDCPILKPGDRQVFFAGRTEEEMEQYFSDIGLITAKTKKYKPKGFG